MTFVKTFCRLHREEQPRRKAIAVTVVPVVPLERGLAEVRRDPLKIEQTVKHPDPCVDHFLIRGYIASTIKVMNPTAAFSTGSPPPNANGIAPFHAINQLSR